MGNESGGVQYTAHILQQTQLPYKHLTTLCSPEKKQRGTARKTLQEDPLLLQLLMALSHRKRT